MEKIILAVHVVAGILFIGPLAVMTSIPPFRAGGRWP